MAHNKEPVEGRCNARYKDGSGYCAKKSYQRNNPKNKRCEFHGGLNLGGHKNLASKHNATKHGLYAKALRDTIKPEDQAMWDAIPTDTDLTPEIQLARFRVQKYQKLLEQGIEEVQGYVNRLTGLPVFHSVHELLGKAMDQVQRFNESQQRMHPEAGTKGDMTINISLAGGGQVPVDEDVPDLDADGTVAHSDDVPHAPDEAPSDEPEDQLDMGDDP